MGTEKCSYPRNISNPWPSGSEAKNTNYSTKGPTPPIDPSEYNYKH